MYYRRIILPLDGKGIECCANGQEITGSMRHPSCWPINTSNDRLYSSFGSSCMNFVRSMLAVNPGPECTFGYGEQVIQMTLLNTLSYVLSSSFYLILM